MRKFYKEFTELERRLADSPYLLGPVLTVLDMAWFIYANRLLLAGYPMKRLHPNLAMWFQRMHQRPEFAKEVTLPRPVEQHFAEIRSAQALARQTLEQIAGL